MAQRWFHKEDGGLIKTFIISYRNHLSPSIYYDDRYAYCSICERQWIFPLAAGVQEKEKTALICIDKDTVFVDLNTASDWVPFFDLSEDLQAVALSEVL